MKANIIITDIYYAETDHNFSESEIKLAVRVYIFKLALHSFRCLMIM